MDDGQQSHQNSEIDLTKTKPMTYFLYPTLHASELKLFLEEHRASGACVNKALINVRIFNPNASYLTANVTSTSFSQEADDMNISRDLPEADTNILYHLSADDTNRSLDLSTAEGTNSSHLSDDDKEPSLDWFDDTHELIQPIQNCFECTLMNNDDANVKQISVARPDSSYTQLKDQKDKPVKLGKKKAFLEFLTSVLRQIRGQLIPNCTNRTAIQ